MNSWCAKKSRSAVTYNTCIVAGFIMKVVFIILCFYMKKKISQKMSVRTQKNECICWLQNSLHLSRNVVSSAVVICTETMNERGFAFSICMYDVVRGKLLLFFFPSTFSENDPVNDADRDNNLVNIHKRQRMSASASPQKNIDPPADTCCSNLLNKENIPEQPVKIPRYAFNVNIIILIDA